MDPRILPNLGLPPTTTLVKVPAAYWRTSVEQLAGGYRSQLSLVLQKKFVEQCDKAHHNIIYAIFNTGQKISIIKFLPMRAGGKTFSWKKFLHVRYVAKSRGKKEQSINEFNSRS